MSGRWALPRRASGAAVLLAHGAGAGQDHPGITTIRDGLAARGHPVLTFDYLYMEAGRRFPDRREVLLECHRAAAAWLRERFPRLVMAGRSMGGRMASYLAAEGEPCAGLVFYAYPLHPVGKPDRPRADHLPRVRAPMLFFCGGRDSMALPAWWTAGSHPWSGRRWRSSRRGPRFRVPKRSGRTREEVVEGMVARTSEWISALG